MKRVGVLVTLLASFVFASVANAATVNVNCNKHGKIGPVLNILNPQGPNTINVTGTCKETIHFIVDSFPSLGLVSGAKLCRINVD